MPWKAIACSEIGTSHKKTGSPCQDYADFIRVNDSGEAEEKGDIVIGAVCDGAGSYRYSDIGSKLAVETTLQYLQSWVKYLKQEKKDLSEPITQDYAHKVFGQNLERLQAAFDEKAHKRGCSRKDFSCTLLVLVATPQWLAAMQIGDGFIVIRQPDSEYQLLFQPQKGEYANQTNFITASNALEEMESKVVPGQQQFIFASTDGLERLALEIRKESKAYEPFFPQFENGIKIHSEAEEKISTQNWLQSNEVNKRTDDDKTILLCWYDSAFSKPLNTEPEKSRDVADKSKTIETHQQMGDDDHKSQVAQVNQQPGVSDSEYYRPQSVKKPAEKEDSSIEFYAFVINILGGIFCSSLWHDLLVDIKFNNPTLRDTIGTFITFVLFLLVLLSGGYICQQKLKFSQAVPLSKTKLVFYMILIMLIGLILGIFIYCSIHNRLEFFSRLKT